ncbi:MAG: SDR family oxidoreductase [Acetobacteraceae bacterium]|nr:SDR family oxidoreductase [Acetobacteraceae bacterium]
MKLAVVTGGTRGIGRAIAARAVAAGYRVIAAARHPPVAQLPDNTIFTACDVADRGSVDALFAPLRQIDALITCAGLAGANRLDGDDALWHAIVASNLHGTYYCCKAAIPRLTDGAGRIVTMASVLGLAGVPDQTAYCAAKHGVVGLTRALALALAPRGITVNALCPGWVATGMAEQRFRELGIAVEDAAGGVPTGRIVTVDEVAELAAFLLSPASRSITGQALAIDGGALARV